MGFDKQLIRKDASSLIESIVSQLATVFSDIIIVTSKPELHKRLVTSFPGTRFTFDRYAGKGPMGGIHAGLLMSKSDYVYVTGCDMPYVNTAFIRHMMASLESCESRVAGAMLKREPGHLEPLNAFYHRDLALQMEERLQEGQSGLQAFCRTQPFLWLHEEDIRPYDPSDRMFHSLNVPSDLEYWQNMPDIDQRDTWPPTTHVSIRRFSKGEAFAMDDEVISEVPIQLKWSQGRRVILYSLPERVRDLVIGWLHTEKMIQSCRDVLDLKIDMGDQEIRVDVRLCEKAEQNSRSPKQNDEKKINVQVPSAADISRLIEILESRAVLFQRTGGTHNMMLVDDKDLTVIDHVEDISRHHALHKLIGHALANHRDLSDTILVTSCRLSATIVSMAARADIPLIISVAAVTSRALEIAREQRIQLIGFARQKRFNLYETL